MAVKLRLKRMGKKQQPTYRIVAADSRSPRDGRFIEVIGTYAPRSEPSLIEVENDRAVAWLSQGAKPSETVRKILKICGAWDEFTAARSSGAAKAAQKKSEAAKKRAAAKAKRAKKAGAKKAGAKKAGAKKAGAKKAGAKKVLAPAPVEVAGEAVPPVEAEPGAAEDHPEKAVAADAGDD